MDLLLAVQVQPAAMQDPTGAPPVIAEAKRYAPRLALLWGDGRYSGPTVDAAATAGLRVEGGEKAGGPKGISTIAPSMGCGTYVRLVWKISPPGRARLRDNPPEQRNVD